MVLRHHETNGRRYLHVRARGDADARLTERERFVVGHRAHGQGLKHIAFELGVSVPTVARALSRALDKLRLHSEMELPAVFGLGAKQRG